MDEGIALQVLKATDLKSNSVINIKAEEVSGLDKPKYKIYLLNKKMNGNQLVLYPLTENQMIAPKEVGEYLFLCVVDWGKGENNIAYWFKINVV